MLPDMRPIAQVFREALLKTRPRGQEPLGFVIILAEQLPNGDAVSKMASNLDERTVRGLLTELLNRGGTLPVGKTSH